MARISFDPDTMMFNRNRDTAVMNDRVDANALKDIFDNGIKDIFNTTNTYRRDMKSLFEV